MKQYATKSLTAEALRFKSLRQDGLVISKNH